MKTVADQIAETLAAAGVKRIYGIVPGRKIVEGKQRLAILGQALGSLFVLQP